MTPVIRARAQRKLERMRALLRQLNCEHDLRLAAVKGCVSNLAAIVAETMGDPTRPDVWPEDLRLKGGRIE